MKYVFFLLGGYGGLPEAELESLLSITGSGKLQHLDKRLVMADLDPRAIQTVLKRLALTRLVGRVLYVGDMDGLESHSLYLGFEEGGRFRVDVIKVGDVPSPKTPEAQAILGSIIASQGYRVNLHKPDFTVLGFILSGGRVVLAVKVGEPGLMRNFLDRWPGRRPFFHPSTLEPRLARAMVNLSECRGKIIVDPFCGAGGICLEAGLVGYHVTCVDIDHRMVRGARLNLIHYGLGDFDVILGDSSKLSLRYCDCVVTDPPYGRSASLHRRTHLKLVKDALENLVCASSVVLASPEGSGVEELFPRLGLCVKGRYRLRVHRSLTRVIYKLVRGGCG